MKKIHKKAIWPQGLPLRFFNNLMVFLVSYFIFIFKSFFLFLVNTHKKKGYNVCVEGDYKETEWKSFFV
jgi:hypothetical protein